MLASILIAALAAAFQQAPPPEGVAPHQQQGDVFSPGAPQAASAAPQPAKPTARRHAHHKRRIHIGKGTVTRASRAAGGAIAGPAGAAVAPALVDRAGQRVKRLVHHRHRRKPEEA